jgi:hypothetical protein
VPHIHSDSKAKTASCRPTDLGLEYGMLAAEASCEPLKEQLQVKTGLLSHGSVDCHISSYFRCWNLLECETMWRRAPDKVALKSS